MCFCSLFIKMSEARQKILKKNVSRSRLTHRNIFQMNFFSDKKICTFYSITSSWNCYQTFGKSPVDLARRSNYAGFTLKFEEATQYISALHTSCSVSELPWSQPKVLYILFWVEIDRSLYVIYRFTKPLVVDPLSDAIVATLVWMKSAWKCNHVEQYFHCFRRTATTRMVHATVAAGLLKLWNCNDCIPH